MIPLLEARKIVNVLTSEAEKLRLTGIAGLLLSFQIPLSHELAKVRHAEADANSKQA